MVILKQATNPCTNLKSLSLSVSILVCFFFCTYISSRCISTVNTWMKNGKTNPNTKIRKGEHKAWKYVTFILLFLWKSNDTKFFFIAVKICWQKKFALQSWGGFSSYDFSGCRHFAIVLFCKQRMWRKRVIRVKSFVFPQLFPWQSFLLRKWKPHSWSSVSYISIDQLHQASTSPRSEPDLEGKPPLLLPSNLLYICSNT